MRTLCVLESVSRADGGIFEAERALQSALAAMGMGRRLVEERFTWPKVAAQMRRLYEELLGR
jgi:glycosyltransferase involved in cell wall biosynthesis